MRDVGVTSLMIIGGPDYQADRIPRYPLLPEYRGYDKAWFVSDFATRDSVVTKEPDERRGILGWIIVTPLRDGVVVSIAVKN
jgi:hypothetical protein